jgi:Flp pilus assembly protein TadD/uncharacterized Zn finger protein (UPF0148 family)
MTKKNCIQCGRALTKVGARFCTTCGATVDGAETGDAATKETAPLPGEQSNQTVSANVPATEALPALMLSSNYHTEVIPQTGITARAEERATAAVANAPVTQSQTKHAEPAKANQTFGGRKRLALVAALCVVALAAGLFFFVNSRRQPETQAETQPADKAETATSPQPIAQQSDQQANQQTAEQSGAGANNQAQPQIRPQSSSAPGGVKTPADHNAETASKQQQTASAKPTPATSQEKPPADGGASAEQSLNQGMTHLNAKRFQDALREFENVKKLDPGNKNVYYLIGQTYHGMNQLEQALEAYRQCTSGVYASVSQNAVKRLERQVGKVNAR